MEEPKTLHDIKTGDLRWVWSVVVNTDTILRLGRGWFWLLLLQMARQMLLVLPGRVREGIPYLHVKGTVVILSGGLPTSY